MSWVEEHPFYMWIIASIVCSFFAMFIYYYRYLPNDWDLFLLWLPTIPGVLLIAPLFQVITEKIKEKKDCNN